MMLNDLKVLLGITDNSKDDLLSLLLETSKDLALRTMYPFKQDTSDLVLPLKYEYWAVLAAKEMYQNIGNEAVQSYSENGLSITYRDLSSGVSNSLLNQLVSKVVIPQ